MPAILIPLLLYIAFLAFAPAAAIKFGLWFALTTAVVRFAAAKVSGSDTGWSEAAKAVIYAAVLPMLALLGLFGFSGATGISHFENFGAIAVLTLLLGSFIGAFTISLGTSLKDSAIVAAIATACSAVAGWAIRATG